MFRISLIPAVVAFLLCIAWANLLTAQTFAETNQRAVAAFSAGDIDAALALTQEVVSAGADEAQKAPQAYLEALNNLTFIGTIQSIETDALLQRAQEAVRFAKATQQERTLGGLSARLNMAWALTLTGDRDAARAGREAALGDARAGDWHGQALSAAVDLAFLNRDHGVLPSLIEELVAVSGGYFAQTTTGQLFERQEKLEQAGDIDGVSALVDARILIVRAIQPDMADDFAHGALWSKFFMNYEAENFGTAATALKDWAATGTLSPDEMDFVAVQAEQSLLLAQLEGYSDRESIQLGFTQMALAFAEISYPSDDHRIGLILREKGAAEGRLGQHEIARQTLQDALLTLTETAQGANSVYLVLEDLASNAWQRGDLDQAQDLFEQAQLAYANALANGADKLSDYDASILHLNRTQLQTERKDYDEARRLLEEAKNSFAAFVDSGVAKPRDLWHHVSLAEAEALIAGETEKETAARAASMRAVEAANTYYPEQHPRRAMALMNAADQLFVKGDRATGRMLLHEARDIAAIALPPDAPLTTEVELKLALDALAGGNTDGAIKGMRRVVAARQSPEHRVTLTQVSNDFEILSWLLLNNPDPDEATVDEALAALQWTQVSQSAEAVAMMEARFTADDPQLAVLLKRRQSVLGDLALNRSALNGAYATGTDPGGILARQKRLMNDARAADEALQSAGVELTGQAAITPLSLQDIQALLAPNEVVVTFLLPSLSAEMIPDLRGSANRAIAIRHDSYLVAEVLENSRGGLNRSIDAFRCEMAISDTGCGQAVTAALRGSMNLSPGKDKGPAFDWRVAHDLYNTLFGGITPLLNAEDHLIIVPPHDLLRLPFQALITEPQPDFDLGTADWLVRHHPVSILPSLAALNALKQNPLPQKETLKILGIGDPVIGTKPDLDCASFTTAALRSAGEPSTSLYATGFQDGLRLANVTELRRMSRLPDATCELEAVQAAFGAEQSDLLLRGSATEERLKAMDAAQQLEDYDIVVFATHGLVAGETSAVAPGLVLTPPDKASALDDGLLTAAEVANLTLSARLVILSACNTAAGRDAAQEGLSGLASGFFQAGARSLMVTHWAVFSSASAEISTSLARSLAQDRDLSNAKALQRSVMAILQDPARPVRDKHPSFWAPFAIVGL